MLGFVKDLPCELRKQTSLWLISQCLKSQDIPCSFWHATPDIHSITCNLMHNWTHFAQGPLRVCDCYFKQLSQLSNQLFFTSRDPHIHVILFFFCFCFRCWQRKFEISDFFYAADSARLFFYFFVPKAYEMNGLKYTHITLQLLRISETARKKFFFWFFFFFFFTQRHPRAPAIFFFLFLNKTFTLLLLRDKSYLLLRAFITIGKCWTTTDDVLLER